MDLTPGRVEVMCKHVPTGCEIALRVMPLVLHLPARAPLDIKETTANLLAHRQAAATRPTRRSSATEFVNAKHLSSEATVSNRAACCPPSQPRPATFLTPCIK